MCRLRIGGAEDEERETPQDAGEHEPGEEFRERKTIRKHDPHHLSEQERVEHDMTHISLSSWCRHCITGAGREEYCRSAIEKERQVPEMYLDYMCMGDEKEGQTWHSWLPEKERQRSDWSPSTSL